MAASKEVEGEKACLGTIAKKQVRYGSMNNHVLRREKFIKHTVQPNDTLQGIALRYGVTMEQVKRANKLWTANSLFLRSTLDIPVHDVLNVSSELFKVNSSSSPPVKPNKMPDSSNGHLNSRPESVPGTLNETLTNESKESSNKEESAADFLIRVDSNIAQAKDKAMKLQENVVYSEDDMHTSRQRHHDSYKLTRNNLSGSASLNDLSSDISVPPHPVVMTQGWRVRSSLRKLERKQDEIFEL